MTDQGKVDQFEANRARLLGLAYRLLGSAADAEDAVQDTYIKWQGANRDEVRNGDAWLTTVCTNRCLDILKSAGRKRVDYIGPWLPEPLQTETVESAEDRLELASSLTTAFLLLLERLTPKERAAYLLREIFDHSYSEVAETLGLGEPACRQLVSRANRLVGNNTTRHVPSVEQQEKLLTAFQDALATGTVTSLSSLLSEDIELHTDGGGKVRAALRVLDGKETVEPFIANVLSRAWSSLTIETTEINGRRGLVATEGGKITSALTAEFEENGLVKKIFIVRNPDKLQRLVSPTRHEPSSGALWN